MRNPFVTLLAAAAMVAVNCALWSPSVASAACTFTGDQDAGVKTAIDQMVDNFNGRKTADIEKAWDASVKIARKEHGKEEEKGKSYDHEKFWKKAGEYEDGAVSECKMKLAKAGSKVKATGTFVFTFTDKTSQIQCSPDTIKATMDFDGGKLTKGHFMPAKNPKQGCEKSG